MRWMMISALMPRRPKYSRRNRIMTFFWNRAYNIILWPLSEFGTIYYLMKEPEKYFDNFTAADFARIIDAYLNGENDYFYQYSFGEYSTFKFKNELIDEFRARALEIDERTFNAREENNWSNEAGRPELEALIAELYAMDEDFNLK